MASQKGKFIVIDGPDATGKKTQVGLLEAHIQKEGLPVLRTAFPRYEKDSSYLVRMYLGKEGDKIPALFRKPEILGPYFASLFYALDRREAAPQIRKALQDGTHVISDRYVTANMGLQGGLIKNAAERQRYFKWILEFEYEINNLPKPDCSIFLHIPPTVARVMLEKRLKQASFFGDANRKDSLDDIEYQQSAQKTFEELLGLYPKEFVALECTKNGAVLSPEAIHEKIWKIVAPQLTG